MNISFYYLKLYNPFPQICRNCRGQYMPQVMDESWSLTLGKLPSLLWYISAASELLNFI